MIQEEKRRKLEPLNTMYISRKRESAATAGTNGITATGLARQWFWVCCHDWISKRRVFIWNYSFNSKLDSVNSTSNYYGTNCDKQWLAMAVLVKDQMLILAGNSTVVVRGYGPIRLKWRNVVYSLQGALWIGLLLTSL